MSSQNILRNFVCFRDSQQKCNFQCSLDDNFSVTHVFIKQICRASEQAPLFPLPPPGQCGGGGELDLFIL
jgi:hypothetical protein